MIVHHALGLGEAVRKETQTVLISTSTISTETASARKVPGTRLSQEMKSRASLIFPACLLLIILQYISLVALSYRKTEDPSGFST